MANPKENELRYPLGEQLPAVGTTLELAPGVRWLRMALPFALDHINLWLLRDRQDGLEGWTIVDCGITNDRARAAGPAGAARDRHAHAPRPHRPGALAHRALEHAGA
jgi:hypothetical protein